MAEKKVSVRLVAENGRQVRAELEGVGDGGARSFQRLSKEVDTTGVMLRRLAGIAAGALSVRQVMQYADTWTDLRSRVDLATGSQERGTAVMERLADMARRTYSSLDQTTESWLSNSRALRDLGLSTAESLDFTEALNNALVVSGARAERATSVQNALSRAMAAGQLSGDQLNTIIETGGRVAELLAEELGTTVSGLRAMGAQGAITGEVIRTALVGNLELLREEADSMPATIGDAFTLIGNAALQLVGSFDQLLGASSMVADALILVADNLDHIAVIAASFPVIDAMGFIAQAAAVAVAREAYGASTGMAVREETLTGLAGASVDSSIAIPSRAIVLGVSARTVTAVLGASSYDCGIAGEPSKFGGSLGVAAGSSNIGVIGPTAFYADTPVRLTANGGNFAGGAVRIAIHYLTCGAPG